MLVDRVGQLVVLLLGDDAVVDDLAIGAVLLELGRAFAQVGGLPEGGAGALALVDDLLLLEEFPDHDVQGRGRHKKENAEGGVGKRTEERRVGTEWFRTLRSRWSPHISTKKNEQPN